MIEPTDEMKAAVADRIEDAFAFRRTGHVGEHRAEIAELAVAAVLALVERDYEVRPRTPEHSPCAEETWSWRHFNTEQVDGYWIRCSLSGPHDEHKDAHTGLTWSAS